jgi:hypothetical protein
MAGFETKEHLKNHYAVHRLNDGKLWIRQVDRLVEYSGVSKRDQKPFSRQYHAFKRGMALAEDLQGFVKVLYLEIDHVPDENVQAVLEERVRFELREWVI